MGKLFSDVLIKNLNDMKVKTLKDNVISEKISVMIDQN